MLRVVAGQAKGLLLNSLKGVNTRPSSGKLKEALFSILAGAVAEASFLDLFAGSGQIGIEALSRGAKSLSAVEKNKACFRILQENIQKCSFQAKATLYNRDALAVLEELHAEKRTFDFIYLDPPWDKAEILLQKLNPLLKKVTKKDSCIILELDEKQAKLAKWLSYDLYKTCHYGRAMLLFYNI